MKRWHVIISYKPIHMDDYDIDIEELEELHNIVELGHDWRTIDAITVTLNRV